MTYTTLVFGPLLVLNPEALALEERNQQHRKGMSSHLEESVLPYDLTQPPQVSVIVADNSVEIKSLGFGIQDAGVQVSTPPTTNCVANKPREGGNQEKTRRWVKEKLS